jgi:hypothetical protein
VGVIGAGIVVLLITLLGKTGVFASAAAIVLLFFIYCVFTFSK